ncbi:MAG TPA: 30S ribosomal protein S1 [Rectinemataceae bacterium]|nr:30S ribosomal protein S1 [Rectinemataceae bacterium]
MTVAIDGPAGSGKSTIARMLAQGLGFAYVNSGNLYRILTLAALRHDSISKGDEAILETARSVRIEYRDHRHYLDGEDVEDFLHSAAVDAQVAQVSAIPPLRDIVNAQVKSIAGRGDSVVEGRDMTTVVFPHAELKIYLDATPEARARRRLAQRTSGDSLEEITRNIAMRDAIDRGKSTGALKVAPGAIVIDSSDLTLQEVYDKVYGQISRKGNTMGVKEVSKEATSTSKETFQTQLQEEYLKSLEGLEEGDLVEGHVIQVTRDFIFLDVGYKSEGKLPIIEFGDQIPAVGDIVSVILVKKESRNGEIIVSKKKADEKVYWRQVSNAFKDHLPLEGTIEKEIKGGFEVNLGHQLRGFLPASKADIQRIEKPEKLIGLKTLFYLERLYSDRKVNIVLNRRKWLEEDIEARREAFFQNTQIGDTVAGVVKSFTSFGAFIDLGGFDGLLHINDMSWGHVTRPKDFVKKGQEIELKVIRMEPEDRRINLSLKHFQADPWSTFEERYHVGDVAHGTVTKLADYGAFIELEEGIEGLAHISEFSWVRKVRKPEEMIQIGDKVDCMILNYDLQAGKVSLGLKQVQDNPWDQVNEKYPVGMRLTRKVVKLTAAGAFIELEEGIDGFLHVDDISWTKHVKNPASELEVGKEIEVMVIESDPEDRNIRVGIKQLSEDPWKSFAKAFRVGSIVDGVVSSVTDFGVFVKVQGDIEGLIKKQDLSEDKDEPYDDALKRFAAGQTVKALVVELSLDRQKLGLSIRDLVRRQQREEMSRFMQDEGSDGYTLGDLFNSRKND